MSICPILGLQEDEETGDPFQGLEDEGDDPFIDLEENEDEEEQECSSKEQEIVVKRVMKRRMERTQKTETELDILVEFVLCSHLLLFLGVSLIQLLLLPGNCLVTEIFRLLVQIRSP